jgi:hypothetical protein
MSPRVERIAGVSGVPSRWLDGEGHVGIEVLEHIDVGLPGVGEDGMPGAQRYSIVDDLRARPASGTVVAAAMAR